MILKASKTLPLNTKMFWWVTSGAVLLFVSVTEIHPTSEKDVPGGKMGCSTFGKHLGLGHREHDALLDVVRVQGMLLNLGTIFFSFVGRFLQMDLEPKNTRKRNFYDKNTVPIPFNVTSSNLQLL